MATIKNNYLAENNIKLKLFKEDDDLVKQQALEQGKSQAQIVRDIVHTYYTIKNELSPITLEAVEPISLEDTIRKVIREELDKNNNCTYNMTVNTTKRIKSQGLANSHELQGLLNNYIKPLKTRDIKGNIVSND